MTTRPLTDGVSKDEPCYGLYEGPIGDRWIQQLKVVRGDTLCLWEQDLGPVSLYQDPEGMFKVQPLLMPSLGDDTVAQLQEFAARNRLDHHWHDYTKNLQGESTLMQDAAREYLQIEEIRRNRSVFGPAQTTQRNGWDTTRNKEIVKAKRRDRRGKEIYGPYYHD